MEVVGRAAGRAWSTQTVSSASSSPSLGVPADTWNCRTSRPSPVAFLAGGGQGDAEADVGPVRQVHRRSVRCPGGLRGGRDGWAAWCQAREPRLMHLTQLSGEHCHHSVLALNPLSLVCADGEHVRRESGEPLRPVPARQGGVEGAQDLCHLSFWIQLPRLSIWPGRGKSRGSGCRRSVQGQTPPARTRQRGFPGAARRTAAGSREPPGQDRAGPQTEAARVSACSCPTSWAKGR